MTLFDVLGGGERVIVLTSRENGQIYTWNQSLTLQCWTFSRHNDWEEVDIRTLSKEPSNWAAARKRAVNWYNDTNTPDV